jgi:hypothetical protein
MPNMYVKSSRECFAIVVIFIQESALSVGARMFSAVLEVGQSFPPAGFHPSSFPQPKRTWHRIKTGLIRRATAAENSTGHLIVAGTTGGGPDWISHIPCISATLTPQPTTTNSQSREKTGFLQPLSISEQKGNLHGFRWKNLPCAVVINYCVLLSLTV